jgi:hypothetical protein
MSSRSNPPPLRFDQHVRITRSTTQRLLDRLQGSGSSSRVPEVWTLGARTAATSPRGRRLISWRMRDVGDPAVFTPIRKRPQRSCGEWSAGVPCSRSGS